MEHGGIISAYNVSDTGYLPAAQIYGGNTSAASDGTVFVQRADTLFAYSFDGSSFTEIANLYIDDDECSVGPDGMVYLYSLGGGILTAYSFDGSSFAYVDSTPAYVWGYDF